MSSSTCGAACILLLCVGCADRPAHLPQSRAPSTNRESIPALRPRDSNWVCDRVVDDFRQGDAGEFPPAWETYPSDAFDVARAEGMYRLGTVDGRRALSVRGGSRDISLGRGISDWDLAHYPVIAWRYRAENEPFTADAASPTLSAVWMTGFPFFVRRLGYRFLEGDAKESVLTERFGQDQWLLRGLHASKGDSWRLVRVNL